jgi:O-antigen ligase
MMLFLFLVLWQSKHKIKYLIYVTVLLSIVWNYMPMQYKARFESIWDPSATTETATESAHDRIEGLKDGYKLLLNRPLFGYGAGAFREARYEVGHLGGLASHNLYGEVMGDLGSVGVLIFLMISIAIYRNSKRLMKQTKDDVDSPMYFYYLLGFAILSVLYLLLFQGNFGHNLYRYTWLWISAFLMIGLNLYNKEIKDAEKTKSN